MAELTDAQMRKHHDRTVQRLTHLVVTHCKEEKVSIGSACICLLSVIGGLAGSMRAHQPEAAEQSDALLKAMELGFAQIVKSIRAVRPRSLMS